MAATITPASATVLLPRRAARPPVTVAAWRHVRCGPSWLGLFDNPVRVFSLEELAETVRALEREQPGRTADQLSRAVFAELAVKRTRRAAELVAEAIAAHNQTHPDRLY